MRINETGLDEFQEQFVCRVRDDIWQHIPNWRALGKSLELPKLEIDGRIIGVMMGCAAWAAFQNFASKDQWMKDAEESYNTAQKVDALEKEHN